ncbi:MAG: proteasome subunit beta, partial [Methanosarcinales archaeon]|nr:proteasome subunit beta [Methanosarcinales archaeon]
IGGLIDERKAVATGSGSMIAYGVLEDRYVDGMSLDEGANLAIRALTNAMKRDSASGNGVSLVKITKDTYDIMPDEDIQAVVDSLTTKNN